MLSPRVAGPLAGRSKSPSPRSSPASNGSGSPEVAREEVCVVDPVQFGVPDRVGHGLLDDLDTPDLANLPGQSEPDRADATEEVEDSLSAGQPGGLESWGMVLRMRIESDDRRQSNENGGFAFVRPTTGPHKDQTFVTRAKLTKPAAK